MHIFAKFHVSNYFLPKGTRWLLVNVHPRMFAYPGRKWKIAEKNKKLKHYCFWNHPHMKLFCQKKAKNGQITCPFLKRFPNISLSTPIWAFPEKTLFFWNHLLYQNCLLKKGKKWRNKMFIFEVFSKNFIICPYLSISWKNNIFCEITPYMNIFF